MDTIRSPTALCITASSHLESVTELQMAFTPIILLLLLNRTGRGGCLSHFPGAAETRSSKLVLKLLFPLRASRKEVEECEICESVCGLSLGYPG